ncbi:MAG TPA: hypothetical protein VG755_29510, partial [Nannocystaceae bacterium]|nr:hypothetical protein [Nannocystaceae bacterium]
MRCTSLALCLVLAACGGDDDAADEGAATTVGGSTSMGPMAVGCDDPMLAWHTANKTTYESYP